ncbi:DNA replication protein psf1 [Geranomyces variabilis]|uniref:DNA replication complex GINS protein PSF1 n=1 Tax=Geranomyces variabilis TaxID=109894 RepID=A0AAD5TGR0_9FUNG|nr:DNA replication protein psf1 [Geranomyces variabilis]
MSVYGDDAHKLIRDAKRTADSPALAPYRSDLVRNVLSEMQYLSASLREIVSAHDAAVTSAHNNNAPQPPAPPPLPSSDQQNQYQDQHHHQHQHRPQPERPTAETLRGLEIAANMHRLSLERSKRCLLAYGRHRVDRLVETVWELSGGAAAGMPAEARRALSVQEAEFASAYAALVSEYRGAFLDVDVGAALVPPGDLFVEVRVLKDCGEVQTESGAVRLVKNSQHYLRRTDVEPYITAGYLRHIE